MAKKWGNVRDVAASIGLNQNTKPKSKTRTEYDDALRSGNYVPEHSYYSEKTGASVLFMKKHNFNTEEDEVARAFADKGFNVVMTPEGVKVYATNKISKKGKEVLKFSEGTVGELTYEQKTIKELNKKREKTVSNAIEHSKDKNSNLSVIYDKYGLLHKSDIQNGITEYERHKGNIYRAKAIIVFDKNLRIHFWKHDT